MDGSCFCQPGCGGLRCEQEIDDYFLNVSETNSTCKDLHLSYQCVCPSGWKGHFCEQEYSECKQNPCKNNSTCTDLYKSYRCECTPGWTGQNCTEEINECDSDPCMNGALCQESTVPGQFVCLCPPFYTGKFCHQRYNPCDPLNDPCKNNSTCVTLVDEDYYCTCKEGSESEHCEINKNECLSLPCQNYGDCGDGVSNFRCLCRPGFSGPLCEIEINECSSEPCENNGTCVDLTNRFVCNCGPGHYGSFCDLDVNKCKTSPCLEEGHCVNRSDGYDCLCSPGYTGINCEINIDECFSEPCLHGGVCIDGINHYTCDCKSGFFGRHCETNANDCFSNPCLHGRCIYLINECQCSCDAGWSSTRCETKIHDCTSIPCMNGGFCQKSEHRFSCICPHGYTGAYCENNIDSCMESELVSVHCLIGGTCVDRPGHTFTHRCLSGFFAQSCEININKCPSSPCHHGPNRENHINGYVCKCVQAGRTERCCEKKRDESISNSRAHEIRKENEPGSTCLCMPGFMICFNGLLCGDEINSITCSSPVSERTDAISTQTYAASLSETSISSFWSARATRIWNIVDTYPVYQGPKQTDIFKQDVLQTPSLEALGTGMSFESTFLEKLIFTRELSAKHSLLSSTDVLPSQFLNFGVQGPADIVWGETSVSRVPIQTTAATLALFFPDRGARSPVIVSSLMTDSIFPPESVLFENYQTVDSSATTMNSVISGIPGAEIELNRHSLLSRGFLLTTASTSAPPIVSQGAQEDIEEYSAVSLISRGEHWRLLSSSMSPIFPAKIIISKQVASLNSSTLHRRSTQASMPSEDQFITEASSNWRLTNIRSQAADSLSEVSQTCATCSMTEIKSSHEFSDQVLHSKQSHFYETFWMNSAILASWYALMGTQTITSGHSFSSATEITPSVAFTEVSSLFPSKKSAARTILSSSLDESITLSSNLDVNLCLEKTCLSFVPSQTVSSYLMNSDLTTRLSSHDLSVSENILKLLKIGQYGIPVGPTKRLNQDNFLHMGESKGSHEKFRVRMSDSSLDFELNLESHSDAALRTYLEIIRSNDLENNPPLYTDLMPDFTKITSPGAVYAASAAQSLPIQTSFPMSAIRPDWSYDVDYGTLTSDLKEQIRTFSEWTKWDLQPSMHGQESRVASQGLSITRSLTLSSLEPIPAPQQLLISGEFLHFCSVNF